MKTFRTPLFLAVTCVCRAQGPATVTQFSYPGASMTSPKAIDASNRIAGEYNPGNGTVRGFLRSPAGAFTDFTCDGADTHPTGINNAGAVSGYCGVPVVSYGFVRDPSGNLARIDFPGASFTVAIGINDAGRAIGYFGDSSYVAHGFVRYPSGVLDPFDVHGAVGTMPAAINAAGQIAGNYGGVLTRGFLRSADGVSFTTFDTPGAVVALDGAGRVYGLTASPRTHWVREVDGTILPLAVPTANGTTLAAVNDAGVMTGSNWGDGSAFVAVPCAPAAISASSRPHGPGNETGSVTVTAPAGCRWTAAAYADWIAHPGGVQTGSGTQSYVVLPNASPAPRTGRLNVAGQILTISQPPGNCTYSLSGPQGVPPFGGSGVVQIVTQPGCGWTASPVQVLPYGIWEPSTWLAVQPPASGFGAGSVAYTAAPCAGCSAGIRIGDRVFTVTSGGGFQLVVQEDATRAAAAWHMNGATAVSMTALSGAMPGWRIAATGDFDANGVRDLVWQQDGAGWATVWFMSGNGLLSWQTLGDGGADWRVAAAYDFDGDGVPDLVWQNRQTREATIWYMSVTNRVPSIREWTYLSAPQPGYRIVGAARTSLAGQVPSAVAVFWQHDATGAVTAWTMNENLLPRNSKLSTWRTLTHGFGPEWKVAGAYAVRAGEADLVWQNEITRELTVWYMPMLNLAGWEYLTPRSTPGALALAR